jgi:uncharacterized protein YwgA
MSELLKVNFFYGGGYIASVGHEYKLTNEHIATLRALDYSHWAVPTTYQPPIETYLVNCGFVKRINEGYNNIYSLTELGKKVLDSITIPV